MYDIQCAHLQTAVKRRGMHKGFVMGSSYAFVLPTTFFERDKIFLMKFDIPVSQN
jgi:hypothetical protein